MSAQTALARGRAFAESIMVDACTVTSGGTITTDDLTGATVVVGGTTVYTGKCRVQQVGGAQRTDVGEMVQIVLGLQVHLPVVGSENVTRGAIVTITTATNDTALANRTFRIRKLSFESFATARELEVEEIT